MAQFDTREAEAVLLEAARRQSRAVTGAMLVSLERLEAMAAELDIAPETLAQVVAEREAAMAAAAQRTAFIRERRATILPHAVPYLSLCLFLVVIWAVSGGGHPWFLYPTIGWGIGVASHIAAVYPARGAAFDQAFAVYQKRAERLERARVKRDAKRAEKRAAKAGSAPLPVADRDTWTHSANTAPDTQTVGRKS